VPGAELGAGAAGEQAQDQGDGERQQKRASRNAVQRFFLSSVPASHSLLYV
jgi:hypothetical protein